MPNRFFSMLRRISLLAVGVVGLLAGPVFAAENKRVLVDIGPIDDDLSRAARTRLSAELTAAGFELTTIEDAADVRATLVAREGHLTVYLELPAGVTTVVRADDVGESEAPEVLAVRAVERIRAGLATPSVAPAAPALPPTNPSTGSKPNAASRNEPKPIASDKPLFPRHISVGGVVSRDGGAFSIAPTIAFGLGIGRHSFLRGSFWGPSTRTTVASSSGKASVGSLGGRLDAGIAFSVRRGTILGGGVGVGVGRYAIEGQPSPGFTPRTTAQPVFLGALDIFGLQALTDRFFLDAGVGVSLALPSVVIRINQRDAGERGFPELHARIGVGFAL